MRSSFFFAANIELEPVYISYRKKRNEAFISLLLYTSMTMPIKWRNPFRFMDKLPLTSSSNARRNSGICAAKKIHLANILLNETISLSLFTWKIIECRAIFWKSFDKLILTGSKGITGCVEMWYMWIMESCNSICVTKWRFLDKKT